MVNLAVVLGMIISLVGTAIGLMVFGSILPNLNQAAIGATSYNLLNQGPIIVSGMVLLGILVMGIGIVGFRR